MEDGDQPTQALTEDSDRPNFKRVVHVPTRMQWDDNGPNYSEEYKGITSFKTNYKQESRGRAPVNGARKYKGDYCLTKENK